MAEEQNLSTENRLLAALSHASVVATGLGIVVGVLIYMNQREKSKFAAFQALQAAVYQIISLILMIVGWIVWTGCYILSLIPVISSANNSDAPGPLFWIGLASMILPTALMILLWLYGLWGALRTWGGHDFRYLIVGGWLQKSGLWNGKPSSE